MGRRCKVTNKNWVDEEVVPDKKSVCIQSNFPDGVLYSYYENRTALLPGAKLPCVEGKATYCSETSCESKKQCYPGATLCERFTKRENYPEWLKCVSVTSGSRREDNPLVERCYDYYEWRELSEKVEEEEATSLYRNHNVRSHVDMEWHDPQAFDLDSYPEFPRIIPTNVTFGRGYCRAPRPSGYSYYSIFCAFDLCNDIGVISRQYQNVTDIPLCYPTPIEQKNATESMPYVENGRGRFAGILIAAFVVFCLVVYAIYKMLARKCLIQMRGGELRSSRFDRHQHHEDSISLLDNSDVLYASRHNISSILPQNFHCLKRTDGRFQLIASFDSATAEKMDELIDLVKKAQPTEQIVKNKFILVKKISSGEKKLDSIRNCLRTAEVDQNFGGSFYESKTFESVESYSTLSGCIKSNEGKTWQDVRDMMISVCELGLFMRGLCKQMERCEAPLFDITPSAFLVKFNHGAEDFNNSVPVEYIFYPADDSSPFSRKNHVDNPSSYYMVQNFKVGSQFRAEQWLVNALKHMLGVGYQLLIPKSERIVITKHPYKQVMELLMAETLADFRSLDDVDAARRKAYTAWLEENGTPECAWNSSLEKYFGIIDDQLRIRLEVLKPKTNDTDLLTSYFGAQNTENNSTVFGFYQKYYENAPGPPMIKVPNYQLNIRLQLQFNELVWGRNHSIRNMDLNDLAEIINYLNRLKIYNEG